MSAVWRSIGRCGLLGAAGALVVALGDFGASWLWLADERDRVELLLRLIALEVPAGALAGALLGASLWAATRLTRATREPWRERAWPLPFVALASPGLCAIAWLLFTGASASRLPMRPLLVAVAALALLAGAYLTARGARALLGWARSTSWPAALAVAALLLGAHFGVTKIDQRVLPGLYDYLHALLTVVAWLLATLAMAVLAARSPRLHAASRARALGPATLAFAVGVLAIGLFTLSANQTVRVALLSPRAAAARSLMLALAPALAATESRAAASPASEARPRALRRTEGGPVIEGAHVLLVTIDALRADHLGLYGYRARPTSAALDRFAAESIVFETAYAQAPHSSYSLSSLMTSEYLYQLHDVGVPLPTETLATALHRAGYHAAALYTEGIFHTDGAQLAQYRDAGFGFPRRSHRNVRAEEKTDEVLAELDLVMRSGEPPSLIWAHYFDVHEPYLDTSFGTADVERYDAEIRNVDRAFERLLREARARVTRPLIVLVTADHGEEFRDHGGVYHGSTVYQEQIRVPLIVHVPGLEPRRVQTPVELVDVAPTLLELVSVPPPPSMRGDDLRVLVTGGELLGPVFASAGTKHMVVSWPHKLIADLRYGTFELYDLERDPRERDNLADDRPALVQELDRALRSFLDSLADGTGDPYASALYRGRLVDRSVSPELATIVGHASAPAAVRAEAARLLGSLPSRVTVTALTRALSDEDEDVRAEAAIALTWLERRAGQPGARRLLEGEAGDRRVRAAIGLGRLRDPEAVAVLIEAIADPAVSEPHRFEAVRLLGLSQDERAVEPLLALLDDGRVRRRAVLALGRIGDARAFEPLVEQLTSAQHSTVRESSARALGQLADPRAVDPLITAAIGDRLPSAGESLVRLGALDGRIGGLDLAPGVTGLGVCRALPRSDEDRGYLNRTYCEASARSELTLALPDAVRAAPSVMVLLRARRIDAGAAVTLRARLGAEELAPMRVEGEWAEHRAEVQSARLAPLLILEAEDPAARLAIDHVLVLPMP